MTEGDNPAPIDILFVEDRSSDVALLVHELRRSGFEPRYERVETAAALREALAARAWDVVVTDFMLPRLGAPEVLGIVEDSGVDVPVIVVSGTAGEDVAVAMVQTGAADYVMKGNLGRLGPAVGRVLREAERERSHRETEGQLREATLTLQTVFEASPAAIVGLDPGGTVLLWNPAAERLYGWSEAEVVGRPLPAFAEGPSPDDEAWLQRIVAGESWSDVDLRRRRKDGSWIDVSTSAAPLRSADGSIVGVLAVIVDIGERKRAEQERQHLEEQLRQAQKMEAVGQLAAGVSHDFNNLLTAILGYCELLAASLDEGDPRRADTEEIARAAERAAELTSRLLAFSRRERVHPTPLDLSALVEGLGSLLRRTLGEQIGLVLQLEQGLPPVFADAGQLENVVLNLAVNSRDAMSAGGTLTISTEGVDPAGGATHPVQGLPPGRYVRLAVSDTGLGMSPEVQARALEPFFTTKGRERGTGLGLAIVWGAVSRAGGQLEIESVEGKGTTVAAYLPAIAGQVGPGEAAPPAAGEVRDGDGRTILVVEDEVAVRELTVRMLAEQGYRVLAAGSAEEAFETAELTGWEVDLLLTDLVLPAISGAELASMLGTARPGLKVLGMSGYAGDEIMARSGELPEGLDLLAKPFSRQILLEAVRRALGDP